MHLETTTILSQLFVQGLLTVIPPILHQVHFHQKLWFLQGAFAGEGSPNLAPSKSLSQIKYTSTIQRERVLISNLLAEFGIKAKNKPRYDDVYITGYSNLKKCVVLNLFKYHPERRKKMESGFSSLDDRKSSYLNKSEVLVAIKKKKMTIQELSNNFNVPYFTMRNCLRALYNKRKINKTRRRGRLPALFHSV